MNVLKTNNRFSSLLEDTKSVDNYDNRQHKNVGRSDYKYNHDLKNVIKKVHVNINMNDFPALIERPLNDNICSVTNNYVEKVLHQQAITEPAKVELLPYGWILLTPNTHNTNIVPNTNKTPSMENTLLTLYNTRKEAYIDLWGDEEYEKMFSFPNHEPQHEYIYFNEDDDDEEEDDSSVDEYYQYDDYDDYYN
jgi:hypothetical protein